MTSTADNASSLTGRLVLLTRPEAQSTALREVLAARGAVILACPVLRIESAATPAELPDLEDVAWLVVTSRNGVRELLALLAAAGRDPLLPAGLRLAAVGPGTAAALADRGFAVDLVPEPATGAGLAAAFRQAGLAAGCRVVRVRGDRAPSLVEETLCELGARVQVLTVYRTVTVPPPDDVAAVIARGDVDAVTFLSPSAVAGLDEGLPAHGLQARAVAACIGTVTAEAARRAGWERVAVAARPTVEDLVAALAAALRS